MSLYRYCVTVQIVLDISTGQNVFRITSLTAAAKVISPLCPSTSPNLMRSTVMNAVTKNDMAKPQWPDLCNILYFQH